MEERLREQGIHETDRRSYERRVRSFTWLPIQRQFPPDMIFFDALLFADALDSQLVSQNHDAQVRFKWSKNDVAIWDNRSNWHAATYDHGDVRIGDRVVSLGEAPYFDAASSSRKAALEKREAESVSEDN